MAQFERGDVGATHDLVVGVHTSAHTVCTWVLDLREVGELGVYRAVIKPEMRKVEFFLGRRGEVGLPLSPRSSLGGHRSPRSSVLANPALPASLRLWLAQGLSLLCEALIVFVFLRRSCLSILKGSLAGSGDCCELEVGCE